MIDIKDYPRDLALMFSGGVESTLLFYLLSKQIKEQKNNYFLNLYIIDRFNNPLTYGFKVFDIICKRLNFNDVNLHVLNTPKVSKSNEVLAASLILKNRHDAILWGINKYPSDVSIRPKNIFNFKKINKIYFPFENFEKDKIIKEFYNQQIEDILPFTHSCGLNERTPCKKCFNCKERMWAYDKLNIPLNLGV